MRFPEGIVELDQADSHQSAAIRKLLFDSYSVEAALIGVEDFPPLRRTLDDIESSPATFCGCAQGGTLVAVAEIEEDRDHRVNIASFAVHPGSFRKGVGSKLLRHVLARLEKVVVTVSTASCNAPAIALYSKNGFRISAQWQTPCKINMVTMLKQ